MRNVTLLLIAIIAVGLFSCKKTSVESSAYVRLINLSPNSSAFDLYINNALLVGGVGFGSASNYIKTTDGNINVTVTPAGTNFASISGSSTLNTDSYNSLFVFDSLANAHGVIITDDRAPAPTGKVNIRFFNFVNGDNPVDILRAGSTKLFSSRSFNDQISKSYYTAYTACDPGPFSVSAVISGTNVIMASLPTFDATAGKSYTLVLKGFQSGTISLTPIADN